MSEQRQGLLGAKPLRRFFHGRETLTPPIKLNRHCVYILPTSAGLGFVLMIIVMLIGAMNYQNNLAYLLGFALISLMLVCMTETYRQLLGLTISIGHIEPVFQGQSLRVPVIIKLQGLLRFSIELEKHAFHVCNDIMPPQHTLTLTLPAEKRGRNVLGLIRISSRFPLGLFRAWTPLPLAVDYLVYPEIEHNPPGVNQPSRGDGQTGTATQGDDDFTAIKAYHPGDAPKNIHWKAYAKGQGLHSKQYSSSQQQQRWFDWQDTQGLPLEKRLSRLTAWLIAAEHQGDSFGLHMPHTSIDPGHGMPHLHRCLTVLALYQQV